MPEDINHHRRRFFGTAAMTIAAAQLVLSGSADAQPSTAKPADLPKIKPGTYTSFGPLQQIDAGVLNIGYAEAGPADGPAVVLLHGWPYDIHSYVDVAPLLASAAYRVIIPYLRGYGTTRFLSSETFRNGQQSVVALDVIALMDALKIEKATIAGYDWGARTANIVAALWPERCKAMVSVSGYLIGSQESNKMPLPPKAELQCWYQYYFATEPEPPHNHPDSELIFLKSEMSVRVPMPAIVGSDVRPDRPYSRGVLRATKNSLVGGSANLSLSDVVEGFGCRPIAAMRLAPWPASESLQ
jgi:pimeloyl-ACP methyl ester carboxylesterase